MSSLADRLRAAREHLFVGREEELSLFRKALEAEAPACSVFYVYGPGGAGKTSLLRAFRRECEALNREAFYVDVRDVQPEPEAFEAAVRAGLGISGSLSIHDALAQGAARRILLIDTYEAVVALDRWLREQFLPELPENVLVALAGRDEPGRAWLTDPGWKTITQIIPLRNLNRAASRDLLDRRGISAEQAEKVFSFAHGHPLATSLVADLLRQQPELSFEPQAAPNVVKTLIELFTQKVPGPAHRVALEASALVRFTTEPLLEAVLAMKGVQDIFGWLRDLSFVDSGKRGLVLHDLAREVLSADLRWRNPEWYAELHRRARRYYTSLLKQGGPGKDQDVLADYTFLNRTHPLVRPLFSLLQSQWAKSDALLHDTAVESDLPALCEMVERHEGPDSARLLHYWFQRQRENTLVYRNEAGEPVGFMLTIYLEQASPEARAADPAAYLAWKHLEAHAPLRAGERAVLFRFWMVRDAYQQVSPVQSLIFLHQIRCYLNTPGLGASFLPCREPGFWGPIFSFADINHLPKADFEVGGQSFAMFMHDWRAAPPVAWLDLMAERGADHVPRAEAAPLQPLLVVLSREDFEEALRDALQGMTRPDRLRDNPLLHSRLISREVAAEAGAADRIDALRRLIEEAVLRLETSPSDIRYYRALHRTYLKPAPTQEKAAEQLDVPFSTYRRHLKRGIDQVTELLWQREIGYS